MCSDTQLVNSVATLILQDIHPCIRKQNQALKGYMLMYQLDWDKRIVNWRLTGNMGRILRSSSNTDIGSDPQLVEVNEEMPIDTT